MADKPLADNPERGWGQVFPMFFDRFVKIENDARNGRSTKSFLNEGRWQTVFDRLQAGDYVFIQFGHNDEKKSDKTRYAAPRTDYRNNLLKFIHDARSKEAIPILLTPVSRRTFGKDNKSVETHPEYSDVVRELAKEEDVSLIDLDSMSRALLDQLGPNESEKLFLRVPPGRYKSLPNGKHDNTHFTFFGAKMIAGLVVDGIQALHLPLESFLDRGDTSSEIGTGRIVCLDNFYNNEWKTDSNGKPVRYHYVWEDTTNSGYSELGRTIMYLGAEVDTLCSAPTKENLSQASLYIIVDPDTPAETPHPNYINETAIKTIVDWVRSGGILLLFGNDKGNAEFEHFNALAGNFGIHFNEDSRNRVVGKNFETGSFTDFPDHPLFCGVKKIYLKDISTLKITPPAVPVLSDKGDVIMAYAKFGNGAVFAVGDPWFYNEYFDNRKLPEGFENNKAAENLFTWLLLDARVVRK
ncbi:MAG: rhamnogalacturonan acetylesterase [Bacteroidota bacterium]|nr:rhamnogalacturonan acetylesterase [Bacteroidota bacterium]